MNNTDYIEADILGAVLNAIDEEVKKCVQQAEVEYSDGLSAGLMSAMDEFGVKNKFGSAEARYELSVYAKNFIVMSLFGKGQKALIYEYGSGSKMDRTNPALKEYIDGDIFNRERLKHNMAIITRVNDDMYKDLDNRLIVRPRPKKEINLEKVKPEKYAPQRARYVLHSIIEQRLDRIMSAITLSVAKRVAFKKLFDKRKIKVVL